MLVASRKVAHLVAGQFTAFAPSLASVSQVTCSLL